MKPAPSKRSARPRRSGCAPDFPRWSSRLARRLTFREILGVELIFVRHGQPEWVREGRSVLDPPLTEVGRRQADRVARRLARENISSLYISPTLRTQQTSEPIRQTLGLPGRTLEGLREIRLPEQWEGAPAERVGQALVEARTRDVDGWWAGLPGGEPFQVFHDRVVGALDEILADVGVTPASGDSEHRIWNEPQGEQKVVIVAHGGTNAVAVGHLLGIDAVPWAWERFLCLHTSVTRLRFRRMLGGGIFGLREHSDVSHLDGDDHTG